MENESLEQPSPLRNVPSVTTGGAYIGPDECPTMGDEGEKAILGQLYFYAPDYWTGATDVAGKAAHERCKQGDVALITAALRQVVRETWVKALQKVAQDFHDKAFLSTEMIGVVEVQAFLDSRHVHYPECRQQAKERA